MANYSENGTSYVSSSISSARVSGNASIGITFAVPLALLLSCLNHGCSKSPYQLAPVRGKVTLDGEPLTSAKVMFAPRATGKTTKVGKPAFGLVDSNGNFTLGTYQPEDGAVVGEHWVTVIRMTGQKKNVSQSEERELPSNLDNSSWDRVTYPETQEILAGEQNEVTIELTSAIIGKFGQADD